MTDQKVNQRLQRQGKLLFNQASLDLGDLPLRLESCPRQVVVIFALEQSSELVGELERLWPGNSLFIKSLFLGYQWLQGQIKMAPVKKAILDLHQLAKNIERFPQYKSVSLKIRALGQGLATIHAPGHALGLPLYYLSAMVYDNPEHYQAEVAIQVARYLSRLEYHQDHLDCYNIHWAPFLMTKKPATPPGSGRMAT